MIVLKDKDFIRGDVPMTKEEIRVLSMSKLEFKKADQVLDIGGGSGAMAVNIAKNVSQGSVTTIERKKEAVTLIHQNKNHFKTNNINVIHGTAPEDLDNKTYNKVFIGGSNGQLSALFEYLEGHLTPEGIVVLNFITLENIASAIALLKKYNYSTEIIQATISKGKNIGALTMMKTNNTITIITGKRGV